MPLTTPKLDDRRFQDIVDEAKKRIPHYCKEWTDHNVSDPGITLVELFAWMTEIILYRMNQVPDLHYIKFMEMLGISLKGPEPAKVPVTFWLSAPQPNPVMIPAGTEVASTQTETEPSIIFTTDSDFRVDPPRLSAVCSRVAGDDGKRLFREQNLRRLEAGFEGFEVFTRLPKVDDALYFGFSNDISHHILGLEMDFDPAGGAGVDPTLPPYIWEASTGEAEVRWQACDVEIDGTKGMNSAGRVRIHLPRTGMYRVNDKELYWVRARIRQISEPELSEGMRPYRMTPRLRKFTAATWGGTVPATHAQKIEREHLGKSNGSPGQIFCLKFAPLLKRKPGEHLTVQVEGELPQVWIEVHDFSSSRSNDRHYTLDDISGELRFGPAIRQQDGTIKLYGAVPRRNANLIFNSYRHGGGQIGNVQPNIINTLKTGIPFLSRVANRQPATGGLDAETIESAMMRAPALLRSRERAVTEADYEFLAREALPAAIGRVKCLQPLPVEAGRIIPGLIYVLVIPRVSHPEGFIAPELLRLKPEEVKALTEYLDERRLLTVALDIREPAYHWVSVKVKLRASPGTDPGRVKTEVLKRLHGFLNPLTGGTDGEGWPFGRHLFASDIYQCLQGIPNVQFIRSAEMYSAKPGGEAQGSPLEILEVLAHGVVVSGIHNVEFV
jgi:predicted phage baseplate assembly protein